VNARHGDEETFQRQPINEPRLRRVQSFETDYPPNDVSVS